MGYRVYYHGAVEIAPPLTEADAATVTALFNNDTSGAPTVFQSIENADPKPEIPYYTGLLSVSEDRTSLLPEDDASRHGLASWLLIAQNHFFASSGYTLNGAIDFEGEEPDDRGTIFVKDGAIEEVDDVIVHPGPSWERNHYATADVRRTVQELLDSSDESGFSSDFIVVAAPPLRELRQLLPLS